MDPNKFIESIYPLVGWRAFDWEGLEGVGRSWWFLASYFGQFNFFSARLSLKENAQLDNRILRYFTHYMTCLYKESSYQRQKYKTGIKGAWFLVVSISKTDFIFCDLCPTKWIATVSNVTRSVNHSIHTLEIQNTKVILLYNTWQYTTIKIIHP